MCKGSESGSKVLEDKKEDQGGWSGWDKEGESTGDEAGEA